MASLTLTEGTTLARYIAQDTSSTNPANTDAQVQLAIEEARQWYASTFPDESVESAGSVAALTSSGTLTTTKHFRSLDVAIVQATGKPLDKTEYYSVFQRAAQDTADSVTATTSTQWGAIRSSMSDTVWTVQVYPIALVAMTLVIYGHSEITPLTGGSDLILFGHQGSRVICRLAALQVALSAGRDSGFLASIAGQLPDKVLSRRKDLQLLLEPKAIRT